MIKQIITVIAPIMFASFASMAMAVPTLQSATCIFDVSPDYPFPLPDPSSSCTTGITGLELATGTFDVTFDARSFEDIWGDSTPTFWGSPSQANGALEEIRNVINAGDTAGIIGVSPFRLSTLLVPIEFIHMDTLIRNAFVFHTSFNANVGEPQQDVTFISARDVPLMDFVGPFDRHVVFTPVSAPAPLALLCLGLMSIALVRNMGQRPSPMRPGGRRLGTIPGV